MALPEPLAELAAQPARTALLFDVDGVLAPIVLRPEDARVPDETRTELRRLSGGYALVACVSGRTSDDARRIVGLPELVYAGEHGLELSPDAGRWVDALAAFERETNEWRAECKRLTLSYHYRQATDEHEALAVLSGVAERARAAGLAARWGRKVLEIRPPVAADKGTAVAAMLAEHRLARALYAGDDTTDLDAFRALGELDLDLAVRVAVASPESPSALGEAADLVVGNPAELLELLRQL